MSPSPAGKKVAWIKNHVDYSCEVVTLDLFTGEVTQLTHEGALIDEVYWTAQNFIIYSSNRGGNFDLWLVSARGGESVQLTRSMAAEVSAQLSTDGKKLLFYETQTSTKIRLVNLQTGTVSDLTGEDANRTDAALSPDNTILAFLEVPAYPTMTTGISPRQEKWEKMACRTHRDVISGFRKVEMVPRWEVGCVPSLGEYEQGHHVGSVHLFPVSGFPPPGARKVGRWPMEGLVG
jgi:Tol biopolymer transport system component